MEVSTKLIGTRVSVKGRLLLSSKAVPRHRAERDRCCNTSSYQVNCLSVSQCSLCGTLAVLCVSSAPDSVLPIGDVEENTQQLLKVLAFCSFPGEQLK